MDLGTIGVWTRYRDLGEENAAEAARLVEELGYGVFWLGGSPRLPSVRPLLEATENLVVATGIVNVWAYDPAQLAAEYANLVRDFPERLLVHCLKNGFTASDLFEDGVDRRCPDEWFGVLVVGGEELVDRVDEFGDAVEGAAADRFVGEFAKPAFDEVEPGARGRGEVEVEARMLGEPGLDVVVFVGAVVVDDQVQLALAGELAVEVAEELEELLVSVARQALADDAAVERVEGGEQGGGAVAFVVVGHRAGAAFLHRQARLCPVQCLDLALLVDAEHERLLRRVEVEPDDVCELLAEARVVGKLERLDPMGLETVRVPDPLHARRADALRLGHRATAPVRLTGRRRLRGRCDDRLDLRRRNRRLAPATRLGLGQRRRPVLGEARTPQDHRRPRHAQRTSDLTVRLTRAGQQHDPGAQRHTLRRLLRADPALQHRALLVRDGRARARRGHVRDATPVEQLCQSICETLH